jgi:hypothetical protein
MARKLVELAKEQVPDDPIVQMVGVPSQSKYSDVYPMLRQVVLALPASIPLA